jgi:PEP-CTERM putative exosortase interaction domain
MRVLPVRALSALVVLLFASSASAVTMDWTFVGNPGNACDPQSQGCFGAVGYAYNIGTYEVTNSQYTEFLNAKAASDPLNLYNSGMHAGQGGIIRTGSDGSFTYSTIAGRESMPVNFVSFYDALRFANWMNNGQGSGDTETGTYTLAGGTPSPSNGMTIARTAGAAIFVTSEDEWYKAAYYDARSTSYFDYPTGSNFPTECSAPTAGPDHGNCHNAFSGPTVVGSYTGSASPYGTFDQGGNVSEWNEMLVDTSRVFRGGAFDGVTSSSFNASQRSAVSPNASSDTRGFRLAMVPEPSTGLLVIAGLLGLAGRRRMGQSAPTSNRPHEARRMGAAAGREYAVRREESFRQRCADHRILHRFECHHALGEPRQAHLQRRRDGHAVRQR